ncbi:hypothetical protein [Macrococcoides canis]|uniref:hypothetical protein n=1 Tax=Macrococcoides canis TaxID=1855823 RepID=UPI001B8AC70D|nr:hypothetical protein [Macrococcus canis]QUR94131.1 hypothetical protein GOY09_03800 [Macrococcus canis]UTH07355.1 hypothetical protein KFV07_02765 [Macrococcus canis]
MDNTHFRLDSIHIRDKHVTHLLNENYNVLHKRLTEYNHNLENFLQLYIPRYMYQELLIVSIIQCTKLIKIKNHYYRPAALDVFNKTMQFESMHIDTHFNNLLNTVYQIKEKLQHDIQNNKKISINLNKVNKSSQKLINYVLQNDANITSKIYMDSFAFESFRHYINEHIANYYSTNKTDRIINLYIISEYKNLNNQFYTDYHQLKKLKGDFYNE